MLSMGEGMKSRYKRRAAKKKKEAPWNKKPSEKAQTQITKKVEEWLRSMGIAPVS